MSVYFLETSALVKLYVLEPGTDRLMQLAEAFRGNEFIISALAPVEARSAIRRRERAGDIDSRTAAFLLERLTHHAESKFTVQGITNGILNAAVELIDRHALRAYDAIQLATCLVLRSSERARQAIFVCSDQQLLDAARAERVALLDPTAGAS